MQITAVFAVAVFGLIVGSFLNALIHRMHSGQSIFERHSRCPKCEHTLGSLDLVPLVSFFALGGKCRYCRKKISWQYPLVEIVTAVSFVLIFYYSQVWLVDQAEFSILNFQFLNLVFQWIFASFLIVIFVYDLKHFLILDKVVYPAAALALLFQILNHNLANAAYGAIMLVGFFGTIYLISRGRWIGLGDVKLGLFLGLLVSFPQTLALFFLAYFMGALVAAGLLAFKGKKMSDRLAFGTFLTAAAFVAMLWGEGMTQWYLKLIGFN